MQIHPHPPTTTYMKTPTFQSNNQTIRGTWLNLPDYWLWNGPSMCSFRKLLPILTFLSCVLFLDASVSVGGEGGHQSKLKNNRFSQINAGLWKTREDHWTLWWTQVYHYLTCVFPPPPCPFLPSHIHLCDTVTTVRETPTSSPLNTSWWRLNIHGNICSDNYHTSYVTYSTARIVFPFEKEQSSSGGWVVVVRNSSERGWWFSILPRNCNQKLPRKTVKMLARLVEHSRSAQQHETEGKSKRCDQIKC